MVFPLGCCVMVAPELLQQRYILSFVFASNQGVIIKTESNDR